MLKFVTYLFQNSAFFGIGLIFALLINSISDNILYAFKSDQDKDRAYRAWVWSVVTRLFITISLLYSIEEWISPWFAREWQDTTPGILFTFGMFGGQLFDVQRVGDEVRNLVNGAKSM